MSSYYRVERRSNVLIIRMADPNKIAHLIGNDLRHQLVRLIEDEQPQHVLFDFEFVSYCPTAMINALLQSRKKTIAVGGDMKCCSMNDWAREKMRTLNLDRGVLDICETEDEAMAAFKKKPRAVEPLQQVRPSPLHTR